MTNSGIKRNISLDSTVIKSLEDLRGLELLPFKRAITEGIDMIMTAHIGMPQIEDEVVESARGTFPLPATLSDDVITGVLREEMGYDGIVITGALNMQAISDNFTEAEAVIKTFEAGVDIALMPTILRTNADVVKLERIFDEVKDAVESGRLDEAKIDAAVERILTLKAERGIWEESVDTTTLEAKLAEANAVVGSAEHKAKEREIAEAAVTLVKNDDKTLPFKPKKGDTVLVISPAKDQTDSMVKAIKSLEKNWGQHERRGRHDGELYGIDTAPSEQSEPETKSRGGGLYHRRLEREQQREARTECGGQLRAGGSVPLRERDREEVGAPQPPEPV